MKHIDWQRWDWDMSDRYEDSSGKMLARVLRVSDGHAHMERWSKKNPNRKVRFSLAVSFLVGSDACGWKLIPSPTPK